MTANILTAERLRTLLHYDSKTGVFTRLVSTSSNARVGDVAGSPNSKGYLQIGVDGKSYLSHRLAWLYVNGEWPIADTDHINRVKTDNRICNLRQVNRSENMQNRKHFNSNNTSGFLGVSLDSKREKWKAIIMVNRKFIFLGRFPTAELANQAYLEAKQKLHPGCTI